MNFYIYYYKYIYIENLQIEKTYLNIFDSNLIKFLYYTIQLIKWFIKLFLPI